MRSEEAEAVPSLLLAGQRARVQCLAIVPIVLLRDSAPRRLYNYVAAVCDGIQDHPCMLLGTGLRSD